jgi:hypothetical protein
MPFPVRPLANGIEEQSSLRSVSGKISRLLAKYNIKTVHRPARKTNTMLRPVKDSLGRNVPGIYCIPFECGKVYVGQTGCTIITARCKEHERHIQLCQPEKSAVAEHCLETGHRIEFEEVTVLTRSAGYMDRLVKRAIEIRLHPDNFNRDNGFILSHAWYPLINQLH